MNRQRYLESKRRYRQKHKEEILAYKREWSQQNKAKINKHYKKWLSKNPEYYIIKRMYNHLISLVRKDEQEKQ